MVEYEGDGGDHYLHLISLPKLNERTTYFREVLASPPILNVTERIDWRECKISKEEETELRNKIKEDFRRFDFTLDDD